MAKSIFVSLCQKYTLICIWQTRGHMVKCDLFWLTSVIFSSSRTFGLIQARLIHHGVMHMHMRQVAWVYPKVLPKKFSYMCFWGSLRLIAPACNSAEISPKSLPNRQEHMSVYLQKTFFVWDSGENTSILVFARLCISISQFSLDAFALPFYQQILRPADTELVSTILLDMPIKITDVCQNSAHFC